MSEEKILDFWEVKKKSRPKRTSRIGKNILIIQ